MSHQMRIYEYLKDAQETIGGYTGKDVVTAAKIVDKPYRTVRRWLDHWTAEDQRFASLSYLGKRDFYTSYEKEYVKDRLLQNCLSLKGVVLDVLNERRRAENLPEMNKTSFYEWMDDIFKELDIDENDTYRWLKTKGIGVTAEYNLKDARNSLEKLFSYNGLKNKSVNNLLDVQKRLEDCRAWLKSRYTGLDTINLYDFYIEDCIERREKKLRGLIASVPPDQSEAKQVRLIFEAQIVFLIDCQDFLIGQIIRKKEQVDRAIFDRKYHNMYEYLFSRLPVVSRRFLERETGEDKIMVDLSRIVTAKGYLKELNKHGGAYDKLLQLARKTFNGYSENVLEIHDQICARVVDTLRRDIAWDFPEAAGELLPFTDKYTRNVPIGKKYLYNYLFLNRFLDGLKEGKITLKNSIQYQDIGALIENIEVSPEERTIDEDIIDQLRFQNYKIAVPRSSLDINADEEDMGYIKGRLLDKTPLSEMLAEVSKMVVEQNKDWFKQYRELYLETTDYMFDVRFSEEEFLKNICESVGFMGRNLRYSDDPNFHQIEYFMNRYISDDTLDLWHGLLYNVYRSLEKSENEPIIIDTKGFHSRKKGVLSAANGRYHTIGYTDLRAIFSSAFPAFSNICAPTDTEAMNIIEVLAHLKVRLKSTTNIYTGDSHTTTIVSAAIAYLSYQVIAAGRSRELVGESLDKYADVVMEHLELLNKVGKLLRANEKYGRILASKKHLYVNGKDVWEAIDSFGRLLLTNTKKNGLPGLYASRINLIETSNRSKGVLRFFQGGYTRTEERKVSEMLKAAEIIMGQATIYNMVHYGDMFKATRSYTSQIENFVLFTPA